MSGLYNAIFGVNKFAPFFLRFLELNHQQIPRLRDVFLNPNGDKIQIYARIGGPNRNGYRDEIATLASHPHYVRDFDQNLDNTYAIFEFAIPDQHQPLIDQLLDHPDARQHACVDIDARWRQLLTNMEHGWDTPDTARANAVGEQLVQAITGDADLNNPHVTVIRGRPDDEK